MISAGSYLLPSLAIASNDDNDASDGESLFSSKALDDSNKKVYLTTSTENFPTKYEGTSTSAIPSSPPPSALCQDEAEAQRIAVFERVAPSVVFIDTFSEQRDAFSTNV